MLHDEQEDPNGEWIMLNVGGKIFTTTRTTLCTNEPNSMLARMFSQHERITPPYLQKLSPNPSGSFSDQEEDDGDNGEQEDAAKVEQVDDGSPELQGHHHLGASRSCENQSSPARATNTLKSHNNNNKCSQTRRKSGRSLHQENRRHQSYQHLHHNTISLRPSPRDSNGAYLIDRSPQYFEPILNYLRHGKLIIDHNINVQGVLEEAKFYGIVSLLPMLELETERWFKKHHHDLIQSQVNYDNQQLIQQLQRQHKVTAYLNNQEQPRHNQDSNNGNAQPQQQQQNNNNQHLNNNNQHLHQQPPSAPLTRQDVIKALIRTSGQTRDLRFQGCNLNGADLSKLDLRFINFRLASMRSCNLRGANLSHANLERADLFGCNLEGTQLIGTNLSYANLENANLRAITATPLTNSDLNQNNILLANNNSSNNNNNNIDNPNLDGHQRLHQHLLNQQLQERNVYDLSGPQAACVKLCATFECANLRQSNLEGSQLQDANFRKAILRDSNLQNCDLTRAILCGADLENCDLSGSDLSEANLRKANIKNAHFELEVS